jgi:hypothetical protein
MIKMKRSMRLAQNALRSSLDYLLAERDALELMPAHNPAEKARLIAEVQIAIDKILKDNIIPEVCVKIERCKV